MNELRERCIALDKEREKLADELDQALEAQELENLKNISDEIPTYTSRLERLKVYIEGFVFDRPYTRNVKYGFKQMPTCYRDKYDSPIADPLEWTIVEYELVGKFWYLEIQFKYYNEGVKKFVMDWLGKNMKWANYDDDMMAFKMN